MNKIMDQNNYDLLFYDQSSNLKTCNSKEINYSISNIRAHKSLGLNLIFHVLHINKKTWSW